MKFCLLFLPLFAAFIGWISIKSFCYVLFHSISSKQEEIRKTIILKLKELIDPNLIRTKIEQLDLENEVTPLLDASLNQLMERLIGQIPMGAFLLSGSLVERVKLLAKEEIIRMLPSIQNRLIEKAETEINVHKMIEDKIAQLDMNEWKIFFKKNIGTNLRNLTLLVTLFAFFLGLLELFLWSWFC